MKDYRISVNTHFVTDVMRMETDSSPDKEDTDKYTAKDNHLRKVRKE